MLSVCQKVCATYCTVQSPAEPSDYLETTLTSLSAHVLYGYNYLDVGGSSA